MPDAKPEIKTVQDAINLLDDPMFKEWAKLTESGHDEWQEYQEPFGIWFRGQADDTWMLAPSVFRRSLVTPKLADSVDSSSLSHGDDISSYIDESSMTNHFMLRAASFGENCRNTFDWLCLMRHFNLPTRLLDWSENLLVALYFAVCEHEDKPGTLFILNARKLNLAARSSFPAIENYLPYYAKHGILIPSSIETALRAEMSRTRSFEHFLDLISSFDRNYVVSARSFNKILESLSAKTDMPLEALATPLAVFPNRLDSRMVLQQSVFTIHGGKKYRSHKDNSERNLLLPEPVSLHEISKSPYEFLREARVENKRQIRMQLEYMGIHEGSLFPELDRQAAYIKSKWEFDLRKAASAS